MNYTIQLRGLRVNCIIGDLPAERRRKQPVILDIRLDCHLPRVALTDELRDTVDYAALTAKIRKLVAGSSFRMIETLADRVVGLCLADSRVRQVAITIVKPRAIPGVKVAVSVARSLSDLRPSGS